MQKPVDQEPVDYEQHVQSRSQRRSLPKNNYKSDRESTTLQINLLRNLKYSGTASHTYFGYDTWKLHIAKTTV